MAALPHEITVRVTDIVEVREILTDAQRFVCAVNDFDNAVAEFGIDHPEHIAEVYQVVHDQLADLRRKYPRLAGSDAPDVVPTAHS